MNYAQIDDSSESNATYGNVFSATCGRAFPTCGEFSQHIGKGSTKFSGKVATVFFYVHSRAGNEPETHRNIISRMYTHLTYSHNAKENEISFPLQAQTNPKILNW